MNTLKILVDMDSIIVALTQKWLNLYNKDHDDTVTLEHLKTWNVASHVKIGQKINDYLYTEGFFLDVPAMEGAIETLKKIQDLGHEVYIVSAPSWPGNSASDKITWARKNLPFINKRDIFLCHHKHMVKGDVFIDDSPDNLKLYRQHWPTAITMTIAYPYNESMKGLVDVHADGYADSKKAWNTIFEAIESLGQTLR